MEKFTKYIPFATLALVVVIAMMLVGGNQSVSLGASGTRFPNGLSADSTSPVAGEVRGTTLTSTGAATLASASITGDATLSGGTLNIATSNTATSTIIGGCFQFYATSTATAHNFTASTTPGIMYSSYGACPNL